jgi:hypothetical protein
MFKTDCSRKAFSKKSNLTIGPEFVIYDSFQLAYDYPFGELISLLFYLIIDYCILGNTQITLT